MDDFDRASEQEMVQRDAAIAHAMTKQPKLQFKGACYNCVEVIDAGLFCDAHCRDDFQKRNPAL